MQVIRTKREPMSAPACCRVGRALGTPRARGTAFFCLLGVALLAGCTTLRPIEYGESRSLAGQLAMGDRIRVWSVDGESDEFKVGSVHEGFVEGETDDGRNISISLDDVDQIERRAAAPGKTVALVGSLLTVVVAGWSAAGAAIALAGGL